MVTRSVRNFARFSSMRVPFFTQTRFKIDDSSTWSFSWVVVWGGPYCFDSESDAAKKATSLSFAKQSSCILTNFLSASVTKIFVLPTYPISLAAKRSEQLPIELEQKRTPQ